MPLSPQVIARTVAGAPSDIVRHAPSLAEPSAPANVPVPNSIKDTSHSKVNPGAEQSRDVYKESLRALRGRYPLAVVLALLAAALGAVAGYYFKPPLYRSEGLLRIAYTIPPVLKGTEQNQPVAMFEGYLKSQMSVMQSQRVLSAALESPAWEGTGRGASPSTMRAFIASLTVDHPDDTDYLHISFEDPDAGASAVAVNSVMDAYAQAYAADEKSKTDQHLRALEDGRDELIRKLQDLRARTAATTSGASLDDLQTRYKSAIERINHLESRRADVRLDIETYSAPTTAPATAVNAAGGSMDVSKERLARTDSYFRGLMEQRLQSQREIEHLQLRFGAGDMHPEVVDKRKAMEDLAAQIDHYFDESQKVAMEVQSRMASSAMANEVTGSLMNQQSLEAQQRMIGNMLEEASHSASELDSKYRIAKDLSDQDQKLSNELDSVEQYIRVVQLESHGVGRLSVISAGEVPVQPFYNPRKKFVTLGIAAGATIGPAVLILFGLLSGKYRFAHETEDDVASDSPLLAILPTLTDNLDSVTQAADVAQSIHHLRVTLQAERKQRSVFMITSACSGEGKTSLAVSLGLSFAASGARTLLIDCDLVGQGITRGFGLEGAAGVREALAKGTVRGSVKRMAHGMRLMPAGNTDQYSGWTVSPYEIGRLVREVRPYYEIVLIDTGPILGSVEACVVAPEVDGVVMTISRGQQRTLVERALQQVLSLGGKPIGFVFNRAKRADFSRSAFHSSSRQADSSRAAVAPSGKEPTDFRKFGPVVRAVAMFLPQLALATQAD